MRLGEATRVSRVYIFEYEGEGAELVSNLRYEWTADGIVSSFDNPFWAEFAFGASEFAGWLDTFRRGELFQGKVSELPPGEQRALTEEGVLAILEAPIFVDGELWGDVGFDDCLEERDWLPAEMDAVRAANDRINALDHESIIYATEHPDKARGWLEAYMVRARAVNPGALPPLWKLK